MQQNPKDIILEVLSIIGYVENKESYAVKFIQNCEKQTLFDLLTTLPKEMQEQFKSQIVGATDQVQQKAIIFTYVTSEQYQTALQKASTTAFQDLLEAVTPMLSTDQADKLKSYLHSLLLPSPLVHLS